MCQSKFANREEATAALLEKFPEVSADNLNALVDDFFHKTSVDIQTLSDEALETIENAFKADLEALFVLRGQGFRECARSCGSECKGSSPSDAGYATCYYACVAGCMIG